MKPADRINIIQLTDLHIGEENENTAGIDVRKNFLEVLRVIPNHNPDFLVITGDLCFQHGKSSIYQWIQEQLRALPFPVWVIAGNHDDSALVAQNHGLSEYLKGDELYYRVVFKDFSFLFLDTAKGMCSPAQYDWLRHQLDLENHRTMVFMHHPPMISGVPFMDQNYPFREIEKMQAVLSTTDRLVPVFCGHYHLEKTILSQNLLLHITPSTFFQIDHRSADFKIKSTRPGYREIIFTKNTLETCVHFLE